MKQKTNSNDSDISFKKKQQKIHRNGIIGMQNMKTDAVS